MEHLRIFDKKETDSPILQLKRLNLEEQREDHKRTVEETKNAHTWDSCFCSKPTDARLLKYLSQLFVIVSLMVFCCERIISLDDSCESHPFQAMLSLLLGLLIPSPK